MNAVDMIIIGAVLLLGLMGLISGILKPASGIGGLILGIILAVQHNAEVAVWLEGYVEGETVRQIAAFIGIVLTITIAARITSFLVKKLLTTLVLGWLDHVAGAIAGGVLGIVLAGTTVFLLTGADLTPTRAALASSKLAPEITRASLIATSSPWCSTLKQDESGTDQPCTDMTGLVNQLLGRHITGKMDELLGQDMGELAEVVQTALTGSPQDLASIAESGKVDALLDRNSEGNLSEILGGVLPGSPQDSEPEPQE